MKTIAPIVWTTRGFEAFRRGTFGNAGQNLYVSRAGVLQRIHLFDLNQDGWLEIVLCNAQEHQEAPPAYVYTDVFDTATRLELPSDGASCGAICDLNGDGLDELILGMEKNGATIELHAFVYYGSEEGWTPKFHHRLPTPHCFGVAAGDFNGDGKVDLAFVSRGKLRIFYQNEIGFEPKRFVEMEIEAKQIAASDLDGDGFSDLYCIGKNGERFVLWGGVDGLNAGRKSTLPVAQADTDTGTNAQAAEGEGTLTNEALAQIIRLNDVPHLFVAEKTRALLVPVLAQENFGEPLIFNVRGAVSVAVGDVRGIGESDLVFVASDENDGRECSWIYWCSQGSYYETNRTPLYSKNACDVAVGDLDNDGCADIALCQHRSDDNYSFHSLVFRGGASFSGESIQLETEGAKRVLIAYPHPDGKPRLIFVNRYSRNALGRVDPAIFWGGPDGFDAERAQYLSGQGAVASIGCDVNDDGLADLVIANCSENAIHLDPGSFVFLQDENGFTREPSYTLPTHTAMAMACADINRDGYLDLIFSGFNHNEVLIFRGSENGFDTGNPQRILVEDEGQIFDEGRRMLLADLNNNGWLDLVLTDVKKDRCFVLWGGSEGFDFSRKQTLSVFHASVPQAADLNGNGYLDLIIGAHQPSKSGPYDSFLYIYWNGPEGLREDRRTLLPIAAALNVAVADFNNNGYLDLFATSYHDGKTRDIDSYIFWGGEDGFREDRSTPVFTHSAAGCLAADFNEDGYIDLAVANHKTWGDHVGESFVLWNGPDGFSKENITRLPGKGPHGISHIQPGNQRDRGDEEYYTSEAYQVPDGAHFQSIEWDVELPPKTWVRAEVRSAASDTELGRATWLSPEQASTLDASQSWLQYRLALGAKNSGNTPRVTEVRVLFQ